MTCYITDEKRNLEQHSVSLEEGNGGEMKLVKVLPDTTFQTYFGMGGAFTEAAGYTWSRMSSENRKKLTDLYFGKDGAGYSFCRTHIQSCDFALGNYSYIEDSTDTELRTFQIDRDKKYLIPLIQSAIECAKGHGTNLDLLASPWSPPAFMKTNEEMNHGGKLKEKYQSMWASMIVKYIEKYKEEGIDITRLTVQNEPKATQTWDSCLYTGSEERDFACNYLKPALNEAGLDGVRINVWDHNKELLLERARECLDGDKAKKDISGVAFHWYSGDHFEQIAQTAREFPGKELIFTEGCVEYSRYRDQSDLSKAERYAHDILGNFNAGANAFIDWNLFLDKEGGPNHVGNYCDAPIMCDTDKGEIKINKSYYYISHFSRFVAPGARRIFVSRYTDKIECLGFANPDNSIVLVVFNRTDDDVDFTLSLRNQKSDMISGAHSIMTICL